MEDVYGYCEVVLYRTEILPRQDKAGCPTGKKGIPFSQNGKKVPLFPRMEKRYPFFPE
jgi:hypothetical protein